MMMLIMTMTMMMMMMIMITTMMTMTTTTTTTTTTTMMMMIMICIADRSWRRPLPTSTWRDRGTRNRGSGGTMYRGRDQPAGRMVAAGRGGEARACSPFADKNSPPKMKRLPPSAGTAAAWCDERGGGDLGGRTLRHSPRLMEYLAGGDTGYRSVEVRVEACGGRRCTGRAH